MDIQAKINQANGRLKAARLPVQIIKRGEKLSVVGTFPAKPGVDKIPHQQRIALGFGAHPRGLALAEQEAKAIAIALERGEFDWTPYLKASQKPSETVGDWVERFTAEFQHTVSETTWKTDYIRVFSQLDSTKPLTYDLLKQAVLGKKSNPRQMRRFALTLNRLAKFAGLEGNLRTYQGDYSATAIDPRKLPTDKEIAQWHDKIHHPGWRWVFGMLATFGLRNHEVFYLDMTELEQGKHWVSVTEGKTGAHDVWACFPEWVDTWNLREKTLPNVTGNVHADFGMRVTKQFKRMGIPFTALDLRHRWAIRTLEFGLPVELAAKQMGHSVAVHTKTYHRSITAEIHQRAYEAIMGRTDRPKPPQIDLT